MECFRLHLPIDLACLPPELKRLGTAGGIPADGLRWLLEHPTRERILGGLRELWSRSKLPLRGWAASLHRVDVCLKNGDIRLVLFANAGRIESIECFPPLSCSALQHCVACLSHSVPAELLEILAQAPGLALNGTGLVCDPTYFLNPLGNVNAWFTEPSERAKVQHRGLRVPDNSTCFMEFAENGIGDHYALAIDGGVLFHDHEAGGLVHCSVNPQRVLSDYFDNPESIIDPYHSGWAALPKVRTLPEDASVPPSLQVTFRERRFLGCAALALALRGCERALFHPLYPEYPVLGPYRDPILRLLKDCRDIVLERNLASAEFRSESLKTAQSAGMFWRASAERQGIHRTHEDVFNCALPAIIQACGEPQNRVLTDKAITWGANIMLSQCHKKNEDSAPAALMDMDYLETAAKGGAITREHLQALFDRPLWP